jgi:predicted TPR repeat methyltransferase
MTKRDLERIAKAAAQAKAAHERRDALIRAAHPEHTVRTIAEAAGLSPARVGQITKREDDDG